MKMLLSFLFLAYQTLALPFASAMGESFPKFYEVSGIAENDVLNVRSGPSTRYRIVGNLKTGSGTIEVLELSGDQKWGRVLWGDGNAWVFTQYLREVSPTNIRNTMIPIGLQCTGTEPYWDFAIQSQSDVTFKILFDDSVENSTIESVAESDNGINFPTALIAASEGVRLTALLDTGHCNDGMTARTYGWEIDLLVTEENQQRLFSGCCSM